MRGARAGYGVGAIGTGVFTTLPGLLLLFYLTDVLGVSAALAAVLLVVPKAWDVALAPAVGAWSDRTASRSGSRSGWLMAGALALPPAFALIFLSPLDGTAGGLWAGWWFLVAASAFALFQVPWNALPAEMTEEPGERTRIMTWRIAFLAVGILVAGGVGPLIAEGDEGSRAGYAVMGLVLAAVMAAALLTCVRAMRGVRSAPSDEHLGVAAALRRTSGSRAFRLLAGAYVLQSLSFAVLLAGAPYVATYRLDDSTLISAMFVAFIAPSLLVMPLWRGLADRFGKARVLLVATAVSACVIVALAVAAGGGEVGPTLALCGVLGVGLAGLQLLAFSALPDVIAADEARTGDRPAGAFTGVWSAGETAGAALGPAVYALALALGGFVSSDPDERVAQPGGALDAMLWGWAALPVALLALSLPLLWWLAADDEPATAMPTTVEEEHAT